MTICGLGDYCGQFHRFRIPNYLNIDFYSCLFIPMSGESISMRSNEDSCLSDENSSYDEDEEEQTIEMFLFQFITDVNYEYSF